MPAVIFSSHKELKQIKKPSLHHKEEWFFDFVHSDDNKLKRNTVAKDVGIS